MDIVPWIHDFIVPVAVMCVHGILWLAYLPRYRWRHIIIVRRRRRKMASFGNVDEFCVLTRCCPPCIPCFLWLSPCTGCTTAGCANNRRKLCFNRDISVQHVNMAHDTGVVTRNGGCSDGKGFSILYSGFVVHGNHSVFCYYITG